MSSAGGCLILQGNWEAAATTKTRSRDLSLKRSNQKQMNIGADKISFWIDETSFKRLGQQERLRQWQTPLTISCPDVWRRCCALFVVISPLRCTIRQQNCKWAPPPRLRDSLLETNKLICTLFCAVAGCCVKHLLLSLNNQHCCCCVGCCVVMMFIDFIIIGG